MRLNTIRLLTGVAVTTVALVSIGQSPVDADNSGRVEITITNLTRGQIMSPAVVATHRSRLTPIYRLGAPASDELAAVAEDADSDGLFALLDRDPAVKDVKTFPDVIMPGASARVTLRVSRRFNRISLAGMLVSTNDAFYALSGISVPYYGSRREMSPAYDAGSEANNETCAFIPGPPCGNEGVRAVDGSEGYVHIHAGIHGGADLDPAEHDWRNPVAAIRIRRLRR